jgi:hypothetical protein
VGDEVALDVGWYVRYHFWLMILWV